MQTRASSPDGNNIKSCILIDYYLYNSINSANFVSENEKPSDTMLDFSRFNSLFSVVNYFTSKEVCRKFLKEQRWGDTIVCPYCGSTHCHERKDGRFICKGCNKSFSVTVGTIFHASNISLKQWFIAMYLVSSHKKGISSCQLARDLSVTQKTAWYMLSKIRTLFCQPSTQLEGEVEMDEMYLGGREKWKHASKHIEGTQGRSTKTKQPIFGMVQRDGAIKAMMVDDTKAATLMPIIKDYVKAHSELFTDELVSYSPLSKMGYEHAIVYHKANEYVNGKASTNCVEGFWSHFRRCIFGVYHHVSVKHLQKYIDEMVLRWNTRKATEGDRFSIMLSCSLGVVSFKDIRGCVDESVYSEVFSKLQLRQLPNSVA